jgi:hypothetical protein
MCVQLWKTPGKESKSERLDPGRQESIVLMELLLVGQDSRHL